MVIKIIPKMGNAILIRNFIEQIWNNRAFEKLNEFLHPDFIDHSLPPMLLPDKTGTKEWIINTSTSFKHHTFIEQQVTEADNSIIKLRMHLTHIGTWRDIEPTGVELYVDGYRQFKLEDGKIIAHWSLIDGQAIENQIKNSSRVYKVEVNLPLS